MDNGVLDGLDDVAWAEVCHAYGPGTDIPSLLRTIGAEEDAAAGSEALGTLWNNINHQGSVYPATVATVPFLLRMAQDPTLVHRASLLRMLGSIARSSFHLWDTGHRLFHDPRYLADAAERMQSELEVEPWNPALREQVVRLVPVAARLLGSDNDPQVRAAAAFALAGCPHHSSEVLPTLMGRLDNEADPVVRVSLVLATAQIAALSDTNVAGVSQWVQQRRTAADTPAEVRLAATQALRVLPTSPPAPELAELIVGGCTPQTVDVFRRVPWSLGEDWMGALPDWLGWPQHDYAPQRLTLALGMLTAEQARARAEATYDAVAVAQAWRSATGPLVQHLATLLSDPEEKVRRNAARALTKLGQAVTPVADTLAAALSDSTCGVRPAVVEALAHCGDHRAVAPLIDLLDQDECPWAWRHIPHHLLDRLRPYASDLLPALRRHLTRVIDAGDQRWRCVRSEVVRSLGAWGSDAADAAGAVHTALLCGTVEQDSAVITLGRIGPTANCAATSLKDIAGDASGDYLPRAEALWAHWRITGDPYTASFGYARLLSTDRGDPTHTLRYMAKFGPLLRDHIATVRALLSAQRTSVRLAAACTLWRLTGDTDQTLPILLDRVTALQGASQLEPDDLAAITCLGCIGPPAAAATPALRSVVEDEERVHGRLVLWDPVMWDQHCQRVVTKALAHITHHPR